MNINTKPTELSGIITPPASKSYLHRALIAASLAETETVIEGVSLSNDVEDTIEILRTLGTQIDVGENIVVRPREWDNKRLTMRESGTTYRLMIPILSVFFDSFELETEQSLYNRPLSEYERLGMVREGFYHTFPLKPGEFVIDGSVSSQFVSGLLMALPLLNTDSVLHFEHPTSMNYVLMTIEVLKEFGIQIDLQDNTFYIKGNQKYSGCTYNVEPDFSSIAFWAVAGMLSGDILVQCPRKSIQPDFEIINVLKNVGSVSYSEGYRFTKQSLKPFDISIKHCPDLAPALAILASYIDGESVLRDVERLVYKESNRLEEILKLNDIGGNILYDSVLRINKANFMPGDVDQNDHRIAMMYAIIPVMMKIKNVESIKKSYPRFLEDYKLLGGQYEHDKM